MKVNINKVLKVGGTIGAGLMLFFGISMASLVKRTKEVWETPDRIVEIIKDDIRDDSLVVYILHELHTDDHFQHMMWEFARLITDDDDREDWLYTHPDGNRYKIDIRATAEDVELAFSHVEFMVYQVYYSTSDNKRYILVHDKDQGSTVKKYLEKR